MNITISTQTYPAIHMVDQNTKTDRVFREVISLPEHLREKGVSLLTDEAAADMMEKMKSGYCPITCVDREGNALFTVNYASKGNKTPSKTDLDLLKEKYTADGYTKDNHLRLLEELSNKGFISGGHARSAAHGLVTDNTFIDSDPIDQYRKWLEHYRLQALDAETWLKSAVNDPNASVSMFESLRASVDFNSKMSQILESIYGDWAAETVR